ncbi:hypothetical protein [Fortiea contorta]|uniref:hypothetical protein n=1 Tax=Fortiea contorta TaxID=1892405 RepID=UPI00034CCBCB|nr:hypothetical protein [Fortiea contorta]
MYTSDDNLIDDPRLTIDDREVRYEVRTSEDQSEVYTMPTDAYATSYESQSLQDRAKK